MKAVILHGLSSNHTENWFPWLKNQLEDLGYEVWAPDLPNADKPDTQTWTEFLLGQDWDFNNNLLVGHSAGAVEVLALLQALPKSVKIDKAYLVAVFSGDLGRPVLSKLQGLNFDYDKIKQKAKKIIVIQSDNDPYIPLQNGVEIADKLNADTKIMHGMQHFSLGNDPRFDKLPELTEIIKNT